MKTLKHFKFVQKLKKKVLIYFFKYQKIKTLVLKIFLRMSLYSLNENLTNILLYSFLWKTFQISLFSRTKFLLKNYNFFKRTKTIQKKVKYYLKF